MTLVCKQESKQEVNLKCMLSSEKKVFPLTHQCTCIKNVFFFLLAVGHLVFHDIHSIRH